jgi:ActR/RegA family two-component response regulator
MHERVLLATSVETQRRLARALQGFDVACAESAGEVRAALAAGRFDLIVVGAHFDESKALEVIAEIRRTPHGASLVCVRGTPFHRVGRPAMEAFRMACEALGVRRVVDLLDYPDDEAGNQSIRTLLVSQTARASTTNA